MTTTYQLFTQNVNEATSAMVKRLDVLLQSLGPIGMQDTVLSRRLNLNTIRYELTLEYQTPGPAHFRAVYFTSLYGSNTDRQADHYFFKHPTYRVHFVHDVSQERRRKLDVDSVMAIYATSLIPNCGQDRSRPVVVQAVANIAAGASGNVTLVAASGLLTDTFSAVNRMNFTWLAGQRGYASVRPGTCVWDAYPTCC
jgi:hypothetical protein